MKTKFLVLLAALGLATVNSQAEVTYSFFSKDGVFDGNTLAQDTLIDLDSGFSTLMTVASTGGNLNSNATGLGIGDANVDGLTEIITFSFDKDVDLNFFDFGGVGSDASDGANFKLGSNPAIDLYTGVSGFNGTSDVYTPASPVRLTSGQTIVVKGSSATSIFDLDGFSVTVIPEPSSVMLMGLVGVAAISVLRKRK